MLEHLSSKTGLDKAVIIRALLYHYGAGNTVGLLPTVVAHPAAVAVTKAMQSIGLRAI